MNTEKVTIRAKSNPSIEVSGIFFEGEREYFFYLILAPGTPPIAFDQDYWERVITLPTDIGAVFRAKVNEEECRILVTKGWSTYFATNKYGKTFWALPADIDPNTVQFELEGLAQASVDSERLSRKEA